jgi:diadenylate cyclase
VIIQNGRIAAAACFLPLTVKPRLSKELGTRHRAAIGVTEETDAVAIIVSEETASISFAHDGEIERFLDPDTLRLRLRDAFERKSLRAPRVVAEPAEHRLE